MSNQDGLFTFGKYRKNYLDTIKTQHKMLVQLTGISLITIMPDGSVLARETAAGDSLHCLIFGSEELQRALLRTVSESKEGVVGFIGGAKFFYQPMRALKEQEHGFILAGPFWDKYRREDAESLVKELKTSEDEAEEVIKERLRENLNGESFMLSLKTLEEIIFQNLNILEQHLQQSNLAGLFDKLTEALESTLDIHEIFSLSLKYTTEIFQASSGDLIVLNPDRKIIHMTFDQAQGVFSLIDNKNGEDGEDSWIKRDIIETVRGSASRCNISAPLKYGDQYFGYIKINNAVNRQDLNFFNTLRFLTKHISLAIINAMNYAYSKELEIFQEISESFSETSIDIDKTLDKVLSNACQLLNAKTASIMLLDSQSPSYLVIKRAKGLSENIIKNTRVRLGESISGQVALQGVPIRLSAGYNREGRKKEAAICIPLKKEHTVIGVLNLSGHNDSTKEFTETDEKLALHFARMATFVLQNATIHTERLDMLQDSLKALANAIDARDPYTRGHSERVAKFSLLIGKRIPHFSKDDLWNLHNSALLHDIGKIRILDRILRKPDMLNADERKEINRHPAYGAGIIQPIKSFQKLIPGILHHHERYDGGTSGYPDRKAKKEIPIEARIIAVADTFDAITSNRPYRKGRPITKGIEILKNISGTQLDPEMVNYFLQAYEEGEVQPILEVDGTINKANSILSFNNYYQLKPEEAIDIFQVAFGRYLDPRDINPFLDIYEKGELPYGTVYNGYLRDRIIIRDDDEGLYQIWQNRGKRKKAE